MRPIAYDTFNDQIGVRLGYLLSANGLQGAGNTGVYSDYEKKIANMRKPDSLDLITYSGYEKRATRNQGFRLRAGRGNGNDVLLNWAYLPHNWKSELIKKFGDPTKDARPNILERFFTRDAEAAKVYSNYLTKDGRNLNGGLIAKYIANASILNAVTKAEPYVKAKRKALVSNTLSVWEILMQDVEAMRETTGHTLKIPSMRRTLRNYKLKGYTALISGKLCNDNRQKVTATIESLLLSLYSLPNKPFATSVHQLYQSFLDGKIDVVDRQTGEFFNRSDFFRNGDPIEISEQTVWNYINNPLNRAIVDKSRMDALDYNNTHRPHNRRHAPKYSFSKVSMDDRDLPRKIIGGGRVKAYYSYDVTSGAVVGYAYSRNKNEELFLDCLRDMFRLMDRKGWGVPMEVEVENHLVNKFFDDLGVMFPIVRICAPGNSQEKRAEHFNRAKKYGVEKATQTGIGRWWARSEAYRTKSNKVSNEYVEKSYEYDTLVADDVKAIADYNNQLHPKQKRYPGMTRWQVLCFNINPNITQVNKAVWMKAIGNYTESSIKRSKFVTVQYNQYELPTPAIISRLKPNNYKVDVYWLPNEFGEIKEVYLYQSGEFLCRAALSETFNEATAEWEVTDKEIYTQQSAYTAQFDSMVKKGRAEKIAKPEIISAGTMNAIQNAESRIAVPPPISTPGQDVEKALAAAILKWGGNQSTEKTLNTN